VTRWLRHSVRVRLAFAAFSSSAALLGWMLWHAVQPDQVAPPAPVARSVQVGQDAPAARGYSLERLLAAVAKDLFHPERRRPGARFRLPADLAAAAAHRQEAEAPERSLRVIGTAVAPDGGGFAMCAWAGGSPRIVRVGERVGAWVLRRVSPGAAEFTTSAGQTIVVRIPKAGS
jgi:hypothetical protein